MRLREPRNTVTDYRAHARYELPKLHSSMSVPQVFKPFHPPPAEPLNPHQFDIEIDDPPIPGATGPTPRSTFFSSARQPAPASPRPPRFSPKLVKQATAKAGPRPVQPRAINDVHGWYRVLSVKPDTTFLFEENDRKVSQSLRARKNLLASKYEGAFSLGAESRLDQIHRAYERLRTCMSGLACRCCVC